MLWNTKCSDRFLIFGEVGNFKLIRKTGDTSMKRITLPVCSTCSLTNSPSPRRYHDSEDRLGEYVQECLNWAIWKQGDAWVNADGSRLHPSDYLALMEQGAFKTSGVTELLEAVSGRIHAAIARGQTHFDDMERSHQVILAGVLAAILYHRESEDEFFRVRAGEQIAPAKPQSEDG